MELLHESVPWTSTSQSLLLRHGPIELLVVHVAPCAASKKSALMKPVVHGASFGSLVVTTTPVTLQRFESLKPDIAPVAINLTAFAIIG